MIKYSFIIPTLNRPHDLYNLLQDIGNLRTDLAAVEVLVFNDGDNPEVKTVCLKNWPFQINCLYSPERVNSSVSRNKCLDQAVGEWLVFLDDDVRIEPDFIGEIEKLLGTGKSAFSFRVQLKYRRQPSLLSGWLENIYPGKILPALGLMVGGFDRVYPKELVVDHLPGANMIFKKMIIGDIRFDEVIGQGTGYLDDADFSYQVHRVSGSQLWYIPQYSVLHLQTPAGGNRELDKTKWYYYYQNHKFIFFKKYFAKYLVLAAVFNFGEMLLRSLAYRKNLWPAFINAFKNA